MISRIAVIVPAANEETMVGRCLDAVFRAAARVSYPVRVVVALDECTDRTAAEVGRFPDVETVITSCRNVGHARRAATERAVLGELRPERLWLANTDADSEVPPHWLLHTLRLARSADLVLGTVNPDTDLPPAIERAWIDRHSLRDGHPHVHGANFGIRASAYLALGGWRPLVTGEDVDLVERAIAAGLPIHRTATIAVRTSTRTTGRAPHGFSSYLRTLGHR